MSTANLVSRNACEARGEEYIGRGELMGVHRPRAAGARLTPSRAAGAAHHRIFGDADVLVDDLSDEGLGEDVVPIRERARQDSRVHRSPARLLRRGDGRGSPSVERGMECRKHSVRIAENSRFGRQLHCHRCWPLAGPLLALPKFVCREKPACNTYIGCLW
jgi:hypothetical protein